MKSSGVRIVLNTGQSLRNARVSDDLDVSIKSSKTSRKSSRRVPRSVNDTEHTYAWKLDKLCVAFPKDVIRVVTFYSRVATLSISRKKMDDFEVDAEAIVTYCRGQPLGKRDVEYSQTGKNCTLFLEVNLGRCDSVSTPDPSSFEDIDHLSKPFDQLGVLDSMSDEMSKLQSVLSLIGENVDAVQTIEDALRSLASAHPIVNIAFNALLIPYKLLQREHEFIDDLTTLTTDMRTSLKCLTDVSPEARLEFVKESVIELLRVIVEASQYVNDFLNKGQLGRITAAQFRRKLDDFRETLKDRRLCFREAVLAQILVNNGIIMSQENHITFLRRKLDPELQLPMDGGCLEGTRRTILSNIEEWLGRVDVPNVLWISGAPGAGKTALASTIVRDILGYDCLKFFIKRGVPALRDPRSVWRSIAFELAERHRGFKVDILDVMSGSARGSYPQHARVGDQFRQLISGPLSKHFQTSTQKIVVVVDALDECDGSDGHNLLETIVEWSATLPKACKLIVTSRTEAHIVKALENVGRRIIIDSGDVVSRESTHDIRFFLERGFQTIRENAPENRDAQEQSDWPGSNTIKQLTKYAAGLFVWAKTVIDFIGESGDPFERLEEVLINMAKFSDDDRIGALYGQILIKIGSRLRLPAERNSFSLVLASLVLLKSPLPKRELIVLLTPEALRNRSLSAVSTAIRSLRPVIVDQGDEIALRVGHKSFSDFLLDEARVHNSMKNLLDASELKSILRLMSLVRQGALLAESCLWTMIRMLKFNICGISSSHQENRSGFPEMTSLAYACSHWVSHLVDEDESTNDIQLAPLIRLVLRKHTLHWMEVLSCLGKLNRFESQLVLIADYMENFDAETSAIARDASKFMEVFKQAIKFNPAHIYISGLPFAPSSSPISRMFGPKFANTLFVESGRRSNWDPQLASRRVNRGTLTCVEFKNRNAYFVTCGQYGIVAIDLPYVGHLDGEAVRVLASKIDEANPCYAIASKDNKVVVCCWNRQSYFGSGTERFYESIIIEAPGIVAATFVSGGNLVLGSSEGFVFMFDLALLKHEAEASVKRRGTASEECEELEMDSDEEMFYSTIHASQSRMLPKEHESAIISLASSPNGLQFVSGSLDNTLIIWDSVTGEILHRLHGHTGAVNSVAWSANGKYIVSGSDDGSIRIWDKGGKHARTIPSQGCAVTCVSFCYNNLIVSGTRNGRVQFSNRRYGNPVGESIVRRNSAVEGLAFSSDRTSIAVLYDDSEVCLLDARTTGSSEDDICCISSRISNSSSSRITSIAFDSSGERAASGSMNGIVRVWDSQTGERLASWPTDGHAIISVQFSTERNCVFAANYRGKLHVLSLDPGFNAQIVHIPRGDAFQWPTAISLDGENLTTTIASATMQETGANICDIAVWTISEGSPSESSRLHGHETNITAIAISSDGHKIVSASNDMTIRVWDVDTALRGSGSSRSSRFIKLDYNREYSGVFSVLLSPNSERFAVGLWTKMAGHIPRQEAIFSSWFEIWDSKGSVPLIRCTESAPVPSLPFWGVPEPQFCADFSSDGKTFANSTEGGVEVWDTKTLTRRLVHHLHGDPLASFAPVKVSPNGKQLMIVGPSSNGDPSVKIWSIDEPPDRPNTAPNIDSETSEPMPSQHSACYNDADIPFVDSTKTLVIGDWSYIDTKSEVRSSEGFVRNSRTTDAPTRYNECERSRSDSHLFWLPKENRDGFWWPKNTAVMARNVTRINCSHFVHGKDWHLCRTAEDG